MKGFVGGALAVAMSFSYAQSITVIMKATADKAEIGTVEFSDNQYGLLITPSIKNLPAGNHGFHLHAVGSCADKAMAAMGHFDPVKTNSHQGPYGVGHLGDLPVLSVGSEGKVNTPLLAPRLKLTDIKGLAVMIHQGGDNYSNKPPLGGGGARIACGVIN